MARTKKPIVVDTKIVDSFTPVHPALDFFGSKAIVSVGEQVQLTYDNDDIEFKDGELTIISDGDCFLYSKKELAERQLYYSRGLDLPMARWNHKDIELFCAEVKNGHKPQPNFKRQFEIIRETLDYYMDFEDTRLYSLFAAFIIYTYFYPLFNSAPILQLWGEMKTGKSKMCALLAALCFNPVNSANISESSTFRLIEGRRATAILDESEDLMTSERGKAICNLLLAGYSKGGETFRQEKQNNDQYKTANFRVFGPKVIANIAGVSLVPLLSRTIRVIMLGAADKTKANREVVADDPAFINLRNNLYRLVMMGHDIVKQAKNDLPPTGLNDRAKGIWEGILTIAHIVGTETWNDLLEYAKQATGDMSEELARNNIGSALLRNLLVLTEEQGEGYYSIDRLLSWLKRDSELEIHTARGLGSAMKRLGFVSQVRRDGHELHRYYNLKTKVLLDKIGRE